MTETAPSTSPPAAPPPPPAEQRRLPRPGQQFWLAGAATAVVVLVAAAGFVVGRVSADDHDGRPAQIERQLPQQGGVPPGYGPGVEQ